MPTRMPTLIRIMFACMAAMMLLMAFSSSSAQGIFWTNMPTSATKMAAVTMGMWTSASTLMTAQEISAATIRKTMPDNARLGFCLETAAFSSIDLPPPKNQASTRTMTDSW